MTFEFYEILLIAQEIEYLGEISLLYQEIASCVYTQHTILVQKIENISLNSLA